MENLIRIREPMAWAMVVLAALMLVFQGVQLVWYLGAGVVWYPVGDGTSPPISIDWIFGWQGVDYALLLVLVVAVAACWLAPVVARARAIALAAAWVTTVTVALPWLVVAIALLVSPLAATSSLVRLDWWAGLSLLHPLITTGVGVVVATALWARGPRPAAGGGGGAHVPADAPAPPAAAPDPDEDERATIWKPSEATGTVWRTADEAAAGAPGSRSLGGGTTPPAAESADDLFRPQAGPADDALRRETGSVDDWRPSANS